MHLQIGDNLRAVHNDQPVYSNCQDIALTLLTRFKIWLVHNCQMEPGPASSVVERSLRKNSSSEGTAVRSPPQEAFSIANLFRKKD